MAHDIRSPLMAMKVFSESLEELPEEKKVIIRTAVRRVSDIASSLTYRNFERKYAGRREQQDVPQRSVILADCIDQIVAEKRIQFRSSSGIEILTNLDYEAFGIFATCNEGDLRRILSNVINNSLEAISRRGSITISLRSTQGMALELTPQERTL